MSERLTVVLDVGKTMAKLTFWTSAGDLVARETRANARVDLGDYVSLDAEGIETWMAETLRNFTRSGEVGSIIPVAHGAAAAIVRRGRLVVPPLDYEEPIGDEDRASYDRDRSPFVETGSPRLPDGLNLGAQLDRLERLRPGVLDGALILPWAQYWAWRLSGVAAAEVSSLGCHTDLWNPASAQPSRLARTRGWAAKMPSVRPAAEVLGTLTAEWFERTGLPRDTKIHCGLHDSNAALLAARGFPEIAESEATVLSTGTWFVAMRSPGEEAATPALNEARDCLLNVDVHGWPIPSARFMGGREIELLTGVDTRRIDIKPDQPALVAAVPAVVRAGARVLPTFALGFGPFPSHRGRWIGMPTDAAERRAAVSLYAALVADASLQLIGSQDRVLVEGRFAEAEVFVRALASLRPDVAIYRANAHNDVSFGALRLLDPSLRLAAALERVRPLDIELGEYRADWRRDVDRTEITA